MTNAVSGLANAWSNKWPMILLAGAGDYNQEGMNSFQESDQIAAAKPFCKWAVRPHSIKRLPFYLERAVRFSVYGTPGPVYIDLPGDLLTSRVPESSV